MLLIIFFSTHIYACLFYITAKLSNFDDQTFIYQLRAEDESIWYHYLLCIDFCVQIFTTCGWGNIPITSTTEQVFAIIWMMFGVIYYSFIIANFSSLISNNNILRQQLNTKLKGVAEFAKKTGLPLEIYIKIKKFVINNFYNFMSDEEE